HPARLRTARAGHPVPDLRRAGALSGRRHASQIAAAASREGVRLPAAADAGPRVGAGSGPAAPAGGERYGHGVGTGWRFHSAVSEDSGHRVDTAARPPLPDEPVSTPAAAGGRPAGTDTDRHADLSAGSSAGAAFANPRGRRSEYQ